MLLQKQPRLFGNTPPQGTAPRGPRTNEPAPCLPLRARGGGGVCCYFGVSVRRLKTRSQLYGLLIPSPPWINLDSRISQRVHHLRG
jgi:hypothetical protein